MTATDVAGSPSGTSGIGVSGGVKVFAFRSQLVHESLQLGHPPLGGADGHAILATRVAAGLTGIQPILERAGQQPIGDVPQVGVLILVCQAVAKVHRLGKGRIESIREFCHMTSIKQLAQGSAKRGAAISSATSAMSATDLPACAEAA